MAIGLALAVAWIPWGGCESGADSASLHPVLHSVPMELRLAPAPVKLDDEQVLIVGGFGRFDFLPQGEIYNRRTGTLQKSGALVVPRHMATGVMLADGSVLIVGGRARGASALEIERYDPSSRQFALLGLLDRGRQQPAVVQVDSRTLLVAGGDAAAGSASVELFDLASNRPRIVGELPGEMRREAHAAMLNDGRVLIVGGGRGVFF